MPYLVTLVVVLTALCLLDLALTVGVVRRLREHTELLGRRPAAGSRAPAERLAILPEGEVAADFEAAATDGSTVSRAAIDTPLLVGVFSPTCDTCHEALPGFLDLAARVPGGAAKVLAVVVAGMGDTGPLCAKLEPVSRVVVERMGGALTSALTIRAFPAFALVGSGGRIMVSGTRLDDVVVTAHA
ncbi:hypothetical protein [Streptomyces sp. NPDC049040]|uniref:hypothetical protein n=1 Tax=Streptomyces sp. NPDC049040 TaxID=3365593 RepID=UPI0037184717